MTTPRQKKAVDALITNLQAPHPKSTGQVLKSVGYGTGLQNQPKRVLESDGVKDELKRLGFDEDSAKHVVGKILASEYEEARDRLKAAEMVFKVHGSFAPDKHVNLNLDAELTREERAIAAKLLADQKHTQGD